MRLKSSFVILCLHLLLANTCWATSHSFVSESGENVEVQTYTQSNKLSFVIFNDFDIEPGKLVYSLADAILNADLLRTGVSEESNDTEADAQAEPDNSFVEHDDEELYDKIKEFARGEFKYQFRSSLIELLTSPEYNSEHTHFGVIIVIREDDTLFDICQFREGACQTLNDYEIENSETGFKVKTRLPADITSTQWQHKFDIYSAVMLALSKTYTGEKYSCTNQFSSVEYTNVATVTCEELN
ncbi:hypothetical protein [Planctobacterium marinum]|uniref:Secreted protein n=1 Tax=Planctobacterium marinum TaxID=1631968 RepID=A0AA48HPC8_9ALTE|nr:hypothetical protein MACH26_27280 [Planctobacterium marinum]